ncbi:hypothetical protein FMM08_20005 [Quadrisphaera setariae]|uniref:NlpC/P60 domain-containing protein n=1 Tax=Quadrisphaera setariae TaxID=2593304 RepID=A0A5C8Z4H0_9ACTN|nr:hypothetical protein FMM08_20005 [Quadrisphaera setariae]
MRGPHLTRRSPLLRRTRAAAAGTPGTASRVAALLSGGGRTGGIFVARAAAVITQRIAAVIVSVLAAVTGVSSGTIIVAAVAVVAVIAVALAFLPLMNQTAQQQATSGSLTGALAATGTEVPPDLVPLYNAAGTLCTQIPATLLAAQGKQESGFNPEATSPVGAQGISQFMPGTWATWGADANGDGRADPFDPADAIPAQGRFMCDLAAKIEPLIASGAVQGDVQLLTLAAYNAGLGNVTKYGGVPPFAETQAYGPRILALAQTYGATLTTTVGLPGGVAGTGDYAAVIDVLTDALGTPYVWGGGGVNGPSKGFGRGAGTVGWDCSSFMQYGFYQATGGALTLPRTAAAQASAYQGNAVPADQLQPGDLLFYGGIASANHVAMYVGDGKMIEEPRTGLAARITTARMDFTLAARVPLP